MDSQATTIYLSSQREQRVSGSHSSFHILGHGKTPGSAGRKFGSIHAFNDEVLKAQSSVVYRAADDTDVIVLPLVGPCVCKVSGIESPVQPGEIIHCRLHADELVTIQNDEATESIGYLFMKVSPQSGVDREQFSFELEQNPNTLHTLPLSRTDKVHVGLYKGREEGELNGESPKDFFALVIEGAFEVNGRLLERRDAMTISNVRHLEFESLTEIGLILVIEMAH